MRRKHADAIHVDAITRTEEARGAKLTDSERDLLRKKVQCFKCRDPGRMAREGLWCSAQAKKRTEDNHARIFFSRELP